MYFGEDFQVCVGGGDVDLLFQLKSERLLNMTVKEAIQGVFVKVDKVEFIGAIRTLVRKINHIFIYKFQVLGRS